jgi:carboxymethylenebutenolidase
MTHDSTQTVNTPDGQMDLYDVTPETKPSAAVIVIHEAFGVNEHIRDVTRRVAAAGFRAVAPTVFHRAGGGTAPYDDFSKVMPLFRGLTDEGILADVDAIVAYLRQAGFDEQRIGIVGFCFGGRVTFLVATRRRLGAGVGFYGGGIVTKRMPPFAPLIGDAGRLATPWLGLFGDEDAGIPVADVEQLRDARPRDEGRPRDRPLSGRRARLPLRPAALLPRGRGEGRLAAHARLVPKASRALNGGYSPTKEPSGAMMKSSQSGTKVRHPASLIDPITRMLPFGSRSSQRAWTSIWYHVPDGAVSSQVCASSIRAASSAWLRRR